MRKVISWLLIAAMAISMFAVASADVGNSGTIRSVSAWTEAAEEVAEVVEEAAEAVEETAEEVVEQAAEAVEEAAEAVEEAAEEAVEEAAAPVTAEIIDFEDGAYGFVGLSTAKGNADGSATLEVVEYNGSNALKVTPAGKAPYVAFNVEGLLGDRFADLASLSIEFGADMGADGKFHAISGNVYSYTGEDNAETKYGWSVYMEKKNPRTVVTTFAAPFVAGAGNYIMVSKEDQANGDPVAFYLDNVKFMDAEGNAIPVDLSAEYVSADTGRDLSNLVVLTNAVEFAGFSGITGSGWGQNGLEMPQEFVDALVPGSVVEIDYESADGTIWVVMPWAQAGWIRVAQGQAAINNSKTTAQIPYDKFVAGCGEDKSTWGAMFQCEAQTDWTVYAVRVGMPSNQIVLKNAVEFPGFEKSAGAWAQDGLEMPQEIVDALVPGSVIEFTFESEDNNLWLVMPWAAAGWSRVAQNAATIVGDKCYVTYEQIVEVCGEDKSTWGAMMQAEGSAPWTVYGVRVGQKGEFYGLTDLVAFPGFEKSAGAWAQDGVEMPQEIVDALVPGSVVTINYESEDGNIWIVMPWASAGWSRVGNDGADVADGHIAQVTYEQIAAVCGEDKATWGAMMQCEGSSNWTVYSVAVGQAIK